jgi:hypothetical protein
MSAVGAVTTSRYALIFGSVPLGRTMTRALLPPAELPPSVYRSTSDAGSPVASSRV